HSSSCSTPFFSFFFYCHGPHRDLHSFPTRRSSDLGNGGSDGGAPVVTPGAPGYLHTQGGVIVDDKGKTVRLTGLSWFGFETTNRSEEHTSELQSRENLVCRLLLEKKKKKQK